MQTWPISAADGPCSGRTSLPDCEPITIFSLAARVYRIERRGSDGCLLVNARELVSVRRATVRLEAEGKVFKLARCNRRSYCIEMHERHDSEFKRVYWWAVRGSNSRHPVRKFWLTDVGQYSPVRFSAGNQ